MKVTGVTAGRVAIRLCGGVPNCTPTRLPSSSATVCSPARRQRQRIAHGEQRLRIDQPFPHEVGALRQTDEGVALPGEQGGAHRPLAEDGHRPDRLKRPAERVSHQLGDLQRQPVRTSLALLNGRLSGSAQTRSGAGPAPARRSPRPPQPERPAARWPGPPAAEQRRREQRGPATRPHRRTWSGGRHFTACVGVTSSVRSRCIRSAPLC